MGCFSVSALQIASYVAGKYSLRRTVVDGATGSLRPIMKFSTQYTPILTAISRAFVMNAFMQESTARFVDPGASASMKHFTAAVFKTTAMQQSLGIILELGDRCGAQGVFEINQLAVIHVSPTTT